MTMEYSASFFETEEDVKTFARKRVNQIFESYPKVMRLDPGELIELHKAASEHVTEAISEKIESGESFDLIPLSASLVREFLIQNGHSLKDHKQPKRKAWEASSADLVTEDSVASVFTLKNAGELRYCHDSGRWFEWTGTLWRMNGTGVVLHRIRELTRELSAGEKDKVRVQSNKVSFSSGAERFCKADPKLAVTSAHWDRDPMLLGTPSGTVDLRTGKLRPSDQADGITKTTAVAPVGADDCPLWKKFLSEATAGDAELMRFLQQWAGYCLTGDISEHAFVFVHGPGGNGKSVFINTLVGVLGDYHRTAMMETFTDSFGDRHPTDLASLRGARMVTAIETEEGKAWAESKIKSITGGDEISARFMRQDSFVYKPQFKLTIVGNHKPTLRNVDNAMMRRINIVPFEHRPVTPDPKLEQKLRGELPAIMRWMIDGCLDWQKSRLVRPKSVMAATGNYFEAQDIFRQWLDEECDFEPGNSHKTEAAKDLFTSWTLYAKDGGTSAGSKVRFGENLSNAGLEQWRGAGGTRTWRGIRLRSHIRPTRDD